MDLVGYNDLQARSAYQPTIHHQGDRWIAYIGHHGGTDDVVVRRISQQGSLRLKGERTFVSETFAYEWIGLRALDERYWEVLYGPIRVGFLDGYRHVFHRALRVALRLRLGLDEN